MVVPRVPSDPKSLPVARAFSVFRLLGKSGGSQAGLEVMQESRRGGLGEGFKTVGPKSACVSLRNREGSSVRVRE